MTTLASEVFANDSKLKTVILPSTLTTIDSSAFAGCSSLATCNLPASLTSIGSNAFNGCSALTQANLGNKLTSIGANAFAGSGLTSVTVPGSVKTLTSSAFENADALQTVDIAEGVTSLAASCFANCDSLQKVNFSSTVATIGNEAFANCGLLTELVFAGDAPNVSSSAFTGVTATVTYPLDNEYWSADDIASFGDSVSVSPSGDFSSGTLKIDDSVYTGAPQQPTTHLVAANGMDVAPELYTVACYADEDCTQQLDADQIKAPGTYYVKATGDESKGCAGTVGPVAFIIAKAPLTASFVSETLDEDKEPVYAIAYEGFVADEDESVLTVPATIAKPSTLAPGHEYTLTPEGAEADNYDITYAAGTLKVNARSIDKPACAEGLVYTGKTQVAVEQGEGYTLSGTTRAVKAGDYEAVVSLQDGYAWSDGSTDDLTYKWSIDKAVLSASFVDETIDYDGKPALKVNVTGFVNGESAGSAAGYEAPKASVPTSMKPGYEYTARVSGGAADNYRFTYASGKITVRAVVIDEPDVTRSFRYDGSEKQAVQSGDGYTLAGVFKATEAGAYRATVTLVDGYEWADGTRAVKSYDWSISAASGSLAIDRTYLSLKIAGAGTVGYAYTGDGEVRATTSDSAIATAMVTSDGVKVEAVGAGTARITIASSECANYTTPASVTITVAVTSIDLSECSIDAAGGTYTGKKFDAQVKVTLPSGDEISELSSHALHYYDSSSCSNEVDAADVCDVGTYWVRAEAMNGGRSSGKTQAASFTIEKAQLVASYAGETIAYGGAPVGSAKVTGFVGGETAATAKGYTAPTLEFPETLARATSYTVTPRGGSATNYAFSYQSGTLKVKPQVVDTPEVATGLVYDGSKQVGVPAADGCVLSGDVKATAAGSYNATATLQEGCVWRDGTSEAKTFSWEISKADVSKVHVDGLEDRDYIGAPITQNPILTLGDYTLDSSVDYRLSYEDNRAAGTASVTVEGKKNFSGTKVLTFKINALALDESCVSGVAKSYAYTGAAIEPEPVVVCGGSTLERSKDYEVTYEDNLSAGTGKLAVTGKGNYTGTVSVNFAIKQVSLKNAEVSGVVDAAYTGSAITQNALITLGGRQLVEGEDYSVSYESNMAVGIASITFVGMGDIADAKTVSFTIAPASLEAAEVTGIDPSYQYTGRAIRPVPSVVLGGNELMAGTDYQLVYGENTSVGMASVAVEGIGNYTGSIPTSFVITKAPYDLTGIAFENDQVTYDGKSHSLAVAGTLPNGVSVSYEGNGATAAGTHVVTAVFTGDDNHEPIGAMTASLVIDKAQVELPVAASGLTYNGTEQTGVRSGKHYSVVDGFATKAGNYVATVALNDPDNYSWADGTSDAKTVTWSIEKAPLRAAYVSEAVSYGENPELGVEVTGFVPGENAGNASGYVAPKVSSEVTDAGSYRLVPSDGAADNYTFDYVVGTLKINRAVVVVAAKPASKVYGDTDSKLDYEVFGTDDIEAIGSVSVSRTAGEDVGEYAIKVNAPGTNNYRVVTVASTFTITKASHDVSQLKFSDVEVVYDGTSHALKVSGKLPEGVGVWYENNDNIDAGSYRVVAHFVVDSNHSAIPDMKAVLVIKPCSIEGSELTLSRASFTYNGSAQRPKVVTIGGNVIQEDVDFVTTYSNELSKTAGKYTVMVSGIGNYAGSSAKATYTIGKANNPMDAKGKTAALKLAKVKKAKQTVKVNKAFTIKSAQGAVSYKKASGVKGITVAKNGNIAVKKGLKKGLYLLKVKVTAAGNQNYNAKTVTVTVKVKVK